MQKKHILQLFTLAEYVFFCKNIFIKLGRLIESKNTGERAMSSYYVLTISCKCEEESLVQAYSFLNRKLYGKNVKWNNVSYASDPTCFSFSCKEIENRPPVKNSFLQSLLNLSEDSVELKWSDNFWEAENLVATSILLEIDAREFGNNKDITIFRYLFMIARLVLREQDYVIVRCNKANFYHIHSYLSVEELINRKCMAIAEGVRDKFFDSPVVFSGEWIPALFLSRENNSTYGILTNPIMESLPMLLKIADNWNEYFTKKDYGTTVQISNYRGKPKDLFVIWICYQYRDYPELIDLIKNTENKYCSLFGKFCNTSGITQILFSLLFHHIVKSPSNLHSEEKYREINEAFNWCCDLGDCILQIAENVVFHTDGGILNIRTNDNWQSIDNIFKLKNNENGDTSYHVKKRSEPNRYVRVSLIDASRHSILENVYTTLEQYKNIYHDVSYDDVTFDDIFSNDRETVYDKLHKRSSNDIVHHYGLMVYHSIVKTLKGCFTLSSSPCIEIDSQDKHQYYAYNDGEIISARLEKSFLHIPGSEYDVIFRLHTESAVEPVVSSIVSPQYLSKNEYTEMTPILDTRDSFVTFFHKPLSIIISEEQKKISSYQELKMNIIDKASNELFNQIKKRIFSSDSMNRSTLVWYFYLVPYKPMETKEKKKTYYGRTEIAAKVLMQLIAKYHKEYPSPEEFRIVLFGMTENQLISFVRQFALFYHAVGGNPFMGNSQLYMVSDDYKTDVLFAGGKLQDIKDYVSQKGYITGITSRIEETLNHIARRDKSEDEHCAITPFPFELLKRMEFDQKKYNDIEDNINECLSISQDMYWYSVALNTILETDIHKNSLGCKLDNIHIQIGEQQHNKSFYETYLLFSNAYWYKVFRLTYVKKCLTRNLIENAFCYVVMRRTLSSCSGL